MGQPWCAFFTAGEGGLSVDCVAKTDQLTLIDKTNIDFRAGPIGEFDDGQMQRFMAAIKWSLDTT